MTKPIGASDPIIRKPTVVILGGGFGGLAACKALSRDEVEVVLVDRKNHHLFQPLLYQVATAGLNPGDIAYPIRSVVRRQKNARVVLGEAQDIDKDRRYVVLDDNSRLAYDFLIVATGATHSYFGNNDWATYAPGLKSIEDALDIRRRVLLAYEGAERETNEEARKAWLTFVVVGGGATGVELAGALSEIAVHTVAKDFRAIDPAQARVLLIEGKDRILPGYPAELSEKAKVQLEKLGATVRLSERVTHIDAHAVTTDKERIPTRTALWAAGVEASPLAKTLDTELDSAGRVKVADDLSLKDAPEVFVIGDLAACESHGKAVPGVAPAASQGGKHAANMIRASLKGKMRTAFHYVDKGSLATIGRAAAVADFGKLRFSGYFAWLAWWAIHILFLIGFRSKLLVMFGWIWSYLTFQRGARLITGTHGSPEASLKEVETPRAAPAIVQGRVLSATGTPRVERNTESSLASTQTEIHRQNVKDRSLRK